MLVREKILGLRFAQKLPMQSSLHSQVQEAFVPAKPWEKGRGSRCVKAVEELPLAAQNHLKAMKQEAADICTND